MNSGAAPSRGRDAGAVGREALRFAAAHARPTGEPVAGIVEEVAQRAGGERAAGQIAIVVMLDRLAVPSLQPVVVVVRHRREGFDGGNGRPGQFAPPGDAPTGVEPEVEECMDLAGGLALLDA